MNTKPKNSNCSIYKSIDLFLTRRNGTLRRAFAQFIITLRGAGRIHYILLAFLFLISCNKWLGVDITSKSQMTGFREKIKDYIPSDARIHEVDFYYADERSPNVMGSVTIVYADSQKVRRMMIDLSETASKWKILKNEEDKKTVNEDSVKFNQGILIAEYDFSVIPEIIEQAIDSLNSKDLKYAGTKDFSILFENDSQQPVYHFTLDGQPKGSPITTKGRFPGIYCHEVYFDINSKGNRNMKINDEIKVKRGGF